MIDTERKKTKNYYTSSMERLLWATSNTYICIQIINFIGVLRSIYEPSSFFPLYNILQSCFTFA